MVFFKALQDTVKTLSCSRLYHVEISPGGKLQAVLICGCAIAVKKKGILDGSPSKTKCVTVV